MCLDVSVFHSFGRIFLALGFFLIVSGCSRGQRGGHGLARFLEPRPIAILIRVTDGKRHSTTFEVGLEMGLE